MRTQLLSFVVLALPWVASCTGADISSETTVSEREVSALAVPEPNAKASEYAARPVTLRLFGTQGVGSAAFATLADTFNWDTSNCLLYTSFEGPSWCPAQFSLGLAELDGVATVMTRPVGNKPDQRAWLTEQGQDGVDHVEVRALGAASEVVDLARYTATKCGVDA